MGKPKKRISVKNIIDICLKQGDLSGGYVSRTRALDGIREHTRVQGLRDDTYQKEVTVSHRIKCQNFNLEIYGRIDGIFESSNPVIVEEIKTCRGPAADMAQNPAALHMAQLKCYGFMIAFERQLTELILQITYVRIGSGTMAEQKQRFTFKELESFFKDLTGTYITMLEQQGDLRETRNRSIEALPFPYPDFRPGQRELAESVYKIVKNEKILFARAPTGTGKTIATLFPAVKSLGLGQIDKIFYLTAKTVGRTVAVKALNDMREKGLKIKYVIITAKQKICLVSDETCDADTCPYAQGYYSKLNAAMKEISLFDAFDREHIESLARQFTICPFELSLDLSQTCDVIICDLNYCFDPRVYLKRYFDNGSPNAAFLIDEAHNLHDRLRSMYSAHLLKSDCLSAQRMVRETIPDISRILVSINRNMLKLRRQCSDAGTTYRVLEEIPDDLMSDIRLFAGKADRWLDRHREESQVRSALLEFYFQAQIFLTISTYFDDNYKCYVERIRDNDLSVRLFCMDPSPIFSQLVHRCRSCILFSATLTPTDFHRQMLFDDQIEPFAIDLCSPFPEKNLGLFLHRGIQATYRARSRYYQKIAGLIARIIQVHPGNYMVYFPSYAFLNDVLEKMDKENREEILAQTPFMSEGEKNDFLDHFTQTSQVTGFAVMGGIFGEGIDLTADRLIGTMIISTGVPQICPERDLIRAYYDKMDNSGFFKSYQMPGFNRVMQAAGRVIRTDTDKGIVVLIDERFHRPDYRRLFPHDWKDVRDHADTDTLLTDIARFWEQHDFKTDINSN